MKKIVYGILLAVSFVLGYLISDWVGIEETVVDERPLAREVSDPIEESAEVEGEQFVQVTEEVLAANVVALADALERSKYLRSFLLGDFKENGGHLGSFKVFDVEGKVSKAFSELYGLDDREIAILMNDAAKIEDAHFRMAKEHSEISVDDDGRISVSVDAFEGGTDLYDQLLGTFAETLGEERFGDFLKLGEREMRDRYHEFGGETMNVLVKKKTKIVEGSDGESVEQTIYEVKESKKRDGQTLNRSTSSASEEYFEREFRVASQLIEEWRQSKQGQ